MMHFTWLDLAAQGQLTAARTACQSAGCGGQHTIAMAASIVSGDRVVSYTDTRAVFLAPHVGARTSVSGLLRWLIYPWPTVHLRYHMGYRLHMNDRGHATGGESMLLVQLVRQDVDMRKLLKSVSSPLVLCCARAACAPLFNFPVCSLLMQEHGDTASVSITVYSLFNGFTTY